MKLHSSQGYLEDSYCCKEGKEKKEEGDQSCMLSVSLQVKWKSPPTQCGNPGLHLKLRVGWGWSLGLGNWAEWSDEVATQRRISSPRRGPCAPRDSSGCGVENNLGCKRTLAGAQVTLAAPAHCWANRRRKRSLVAVAVTERGALAGASEGKGGANR